MCTTIIHHQKRQHEEPVKYSGGLFNEPPQSNPIYSRGLLFCIYDDVLGVIMRHCGNCKWRRYTSEMKKKQFNSDVADLQAIYDSISLTSDDQLLRSKITAIEMEFMRLYTEDEMFILCNKNSLLTLLRINLSFRFIPLQLFGLKKG